MKRSIAMLPRHGSTGDPRLRAVALATLLGYGAFASVRLLAERCVVGVLDPILWLVPLTGLIGGLLRTGRTWKDHPAVVTTIATLAIASIADMAHVSYVPALWESAERGVMDHRHGAELVLVVALLPALFAKLGRRIGDGCAVEDHRVHAVRDSAVGMALGTVAGLAAVEGLGGYVAVTLFIAVVTAVSATRRHAAVVLVSGVAAIAWIALKPHQFFPTTPDLAWVERAWSAHQKLDRLSGAGCDAWVLNELTMRPDCSARDEPSGAPDPLLAAFAHERRVDDVVYLSFGAPRPVEPLLKALDGASRITFVTPERRIARWLADVLTSRAAADSSGRVRVAVASEPRSFVEGLARPADLVVVDGVDLPLVAGLLMPIPQAAGLFTREGFTSLVGHLAPDGVILIERLAAKPEDLSRVVASASPALRIAAAECPTSSRPISALPCAWIGLARSDAALVVVERAFRAIPGTQPLPTPAAHAGNATTDARPVAVLPATFLLTELGLAVVILGVAARASRRDRRYHARAVSRRCLASGASLALAQSAVVTSLGGAGAYPGERAVLVLASTWLGVAIGAHLAARAGSRCLPWAPRPSVWAGTATGGALAVAALALAVAAPRANHGLAFALAVLAGYPTGLGWSSLVNAGSVPDARGLWAVAWLGYTLGMLLAPALLVAHGFDLVILVGALCAVVALSTSGRDRWEGAQGIADGGPVVSP